MINKLFPRIYYDNTKYAEGKQLYMDALAYTVQKHLYMRRNAVYYLGGTITLWDFMTLTRYYISASTSEYGPSDMETYISAMHDPYASFLADDVVKYSQDKKFILLNGTSALVLSMLWAAWIYARVRLDIIIEEKGKWQMAAEQLYDTMRDFYESPDNQCFGENNILLNIADDAMKTMGTYMAEQVRKGKYNQSKQPVFNNKQSAHVGDDVSKLQVRIMELENELNNLRKNLSWDSGDDTQDLQQQMNEANKKIEERDAEIKSLKEVNERLKQERDDFEGNIHIEEGKLSDMLQAYYELKEKYEKTSQSASQNDVKVGWIDWLDDDVFHPNINAEKVANAIHDIQAPHLSTNCYWYVVYRILDKIHWLAKGATQKALLKWANAHFQYGWKGDQQFKFSDVNNNIKKADPFAWDEHTMKTNQGQYYRELADKLMSTFVDRVDNGKLIDKSAFIRGRKRVNDIH